jgi:hypothetical protein
MSEPLFPLEPESAPSESPPCPFCDGLDTERISGFGGQLSVSQCWCRRCRTGFEWLKWGEEAESRDIRGNTRPGSG